MLKAVSVGLILIVGNSFASATPIDASIAARVRGGVRFSCIRRLNDEDSEKDIPYSKITSFCSCFANAILPSMTMADVAGGNQFKMNDPRLIMANNLCAKILRIK